MDILTMENSRCNLRRVVIYEDLMSGTCRETSFWRALCPACSVGLIRGTWIVDMMMYSLPRNGWKAEAITSLWFFSLIRLEKFIQPKLSHKFSGGFWHCLFCSFGGVGLLEGFHGVRTWQVVKVLRPRVRERAFGSSTTTTTTTSLFTMGKGGKRFARVGVCWGVDPLGSGWIGNESLAAGYDRDETSPIPMASQMSRNLLNKPNGHDVRLNNTVAEDTDII